jgi:beta-glucosidase
MQAITLTSRILASLGLVLLAAACGPQVPAGPTISAPAVTAPAAVAPGATGSPIQAPAAEDPADGPAGAPALYLDPQAPVEERVADLLVRMTLAEKIGQMTQVEKDSIRRDDIARLSIGSLLSGGGGSPSTNTTEAWVEMVDGFQEFALQSRLGIPLIYGVDAVHGHNNLKGATIFPHNIGLGAANDPELVEQIARATAEEMAATGIRWNFAPVVAVPQDIRWGRAYEGFSEDTEIVTALGAAYVRGLQNAGDPAGLGHPLAALATPKHFIGDGGAEWGTSPIPDFEIDRGDVRVDEAALRALYLPPYQAAIQAGAQSIMVSFSSWNGTKMHAHQYLLTGVLKGELGFAGFLVSDWQAIEEIPGSGYSDVVTSINAGLDMIMVPYDYQAFIENATRAVDNGDIPLERIDDAVRRILAVKFKLGLFERPYADPILLGQVGSAEHRALARQAVTKSLVLLQNEGPVLPLSKDVPLLFVGGSAADDVGIQCGGWTIEWQGKRGDILPGVTILEGIRQAAADPERVHYDADGRFEGETTADGQPAVAEVGIAVVGEIPYAEGVGDRGDLSLSAEDVALIQRMRERSQKLVVILVSGRPLVITEQLPLAEAWVAAWLPGSEGQGVADVLFGDQPFTGRLPYTWPRSNDQVLDRESPLFPLGFGLE